MPFCCVEKAPGSLSGRRGDRGIRGKTLFRKKGKDLIVCADKSCGYKRETPENEK